MQERSADSGFECTNAAQLEGCLGPEDIDTFIACIRKRLDTQCDNLQQPVESATISVLLPEDIDTFIASHGSVHGEEQSSLCSEPLITSNDLEPLPPPPPADPSPDECTRYVLARAREKQQTHKSECVTH